MLVDKGSHERVPDHVDYTYYKEHDSGCCGIKPEDVGVEEQQIHADCLVNEILGQVS